MALEIDDHAGAQACCLTSLSMRPSLPAPVTTTIVAAGVCRLVQLRLPWLTAGVVVLCLVQLSDSLSQGLLLAASSASWLAVLKLWTLRAGPCLPILPLALLVRWLVYALPLIVLPAAQLPDPLIDLVAPSLLIWPWAIFCGWALFPDHWLRLRPQPSLLGFGSAIALLPHLLLGAALVLFWMLNSELYWSLLGPLATSLRNPITTLIALLILPGGFIGAFRWARGQLQDPPVFWVLVVLFFATYLLSFLLSSAQNLVLAVLLGLWVGRARQALPITLSLILMLAFLHPGKFAMREKYWDGAIPKPSPPELMLEWVNASVDQLFNPQPSAKVQGLDKRLSNLGMLAYVNVQLQNGTPPLDGASYALIPQVLIPRVLNSEKVRSQEGQVLLNLHFGRQATRAQTETTYIAWGFLPEAVGNFGPWLGPFLVGLAFGALIRAAELRGAAQDLLSKPGLESLVLMVLCTSSYEMVATTFSAAAFQIIILIEILCSLLIGRSSYGRLKP